MTKAILPSSKASRRLLERKAAATAFKQGAAAAFQRPLSRLSPWAAEAAELSYFGWLLSVTSFGNYRISKDFVHFDFEPCSMLARLTQIEYSSSILTTEYV